MSREYSDGTPNVYIDFYTPAGKPHYITDVTGGRTPSYDFAGRTIGETWDSWFAGLTLTSHSDPVYGRDSLTLDGICYNWNPVAFEQHYAYETNTGRLKSVSQPAVLNGPAISASYAYLPNSDLLQTTTYSNANSAVLTTTRAWEFGSRLRSIANVANNVGVNTHSYLYDNLNRRRQDALEDGSNWKYEYNDRNEVTGASRYWSDWTPVVGQQFGYSYDSIGNRLRATEGGDASGGSLRTETYGVNSLNQYTNRIRSNPDALDVSGMAYANATVTVNGRSPVRQGEYYDCALPISGNWSTTVILRHQRQLKFDIMAGLHFVVLLCFPVLFQPPRWNEAFGA